MPPTRPFPCGIENEPDCPPQPVSGVLTIEEAFVYGAEQYAKGHRDHAAMIEKEQQAKVKEGL